MWRSLVGSILFLSIASGAQALQPSHCAPRNELVSKLAAQYGEQPVAIGVSTNGRLFEVLASQPGGSFTVIMTSPQGMSCIVLAGHGWQAKFSAQAGITA